MKIIKYIFLFLYLLLFSFHCYLSLQNASSSTKTSMKVTEVVVEIEEKVFNIENVDVERVDCNVRKIIGHYAYFGLIGIFGFLCIYFYLFSIKKTLIISLIIGFIMSSISELLQLFSIERGPSIVDVFIDFSGYLTSSIIVLIIVYIILKKKEKKQV